MALTLLLAEEFGIRGGSYCEKRVEKGLRYSHYLVCD